MSFSSSSKKELNHSSEDFLDDSLAAFKLEYLYFSAINSNSKNMFTNIRSYTECMTVLLVSRVTYRERREPSIIQGRYYVITKLTT